MKSPWLPALVLLATVVGAWPQDGAVLRPLPIEQHGEGGILSMAVYLATPEAQGFAATHAATALGIPFMVTRDLESARRHPFIVVDGPLGPLPADAEADLSDWVHVGGTLVVDDLSSETARTLAHVTSTVVSNAGGHVTFDTSTHNPGLTHVVTPAAERITIQGPVTEIGTPIDGQVVARFDDGSAAIVDHTDNWGHVIALGCSFDRLILWPQNHWRGTPANARHFNPEGDIPQYLLRDWYMGYVHGAAALDTTPAALTGSLVVTHDVDTVAALDHTLEFARLEKAAQAGATYFVPTEPTFLNVHARHVLDQLKALGMDIQPAATRAQSRTRLQRLLPGTVIDTSRGVVRGPLDLAAMESAGYHHDSSLLADDVTTVFPYYIMENGGTQRESQVVEFPLLSTDGPPADLVALLDDEATLHGVCLLQLGLQSPALERSLLEHVKGHFITPCIRDLANWWDGRQRTRMDILPRGGKWVIRLRSPIDIYGLTVNFPEPRTLASGQGAVQFDATRVVVPTLHGGIPIEFTVEDNSGHK